MDAHLRTRIGRFLSKPHDKWWEITTATDVSSLAQDVSALVLNSGVPYVLRHLTNDSITSLWESGQSPGLTDGQRADLLRRLKGGKA